MRTFRYLLIAAMTLVTGTQAQAQSRWQSQFEDEDGTRYEVDARGEVRFSDDDAGIASLSSDGFFHLVYRDRKGTRELTVRPGQDGRLDYVYVVDRERREYDAGARAEMAPIFLHVIRRTGIGAEQRVARILRTKGVEGVLAEIAMLGSSGVNSRYFMELVEQATLSTTQRVQIARLAADRISSSGDRSRFLIASIGKFMQDDPSAEAYMDAACTIQSSGDRSRVLIATLDHRLSQRAATALVTCAKGIESSGDLSRVLVAASPVFTTRPEFRNAWFEAVARISSSGDRSRVLISLLDRDDLDEVTLLGVIESAAAIESSGDKARVLVSAAPRVRTDGLVSAYVKTAEGISASGDRGRALSALVSAN